MTSQQALMLAAVVAFFGCEALWLWWQGKKIDRKYGGPADKAPPAGE